MKKIYAVFIVLIPILSYYSSPIPTLDLVTFLAILFLPLLSIKNGLVNVNRKITVLIFLLFSLLSIFINVIFYTYNLVAFLRFAKLAVLFIILFVAVKEKYFDESIAVKVLRVVSIVAVIYILLQYYSYYLKDYILPNGLFLDSVKAQGYAQIDLYEAALNLFRTSGFFLEPSHFTLFVILDLIIILFRENKSRKKSIIEALFISLGIILSTSGQGIMYALVVWFLFYVQFNRTCKVSYVKVGKVILMSPIIIGVSILLSKVPLIHSIFLRVFDMNVLGGNAIIARTSSYSYIFTNSLVQNIVGVGYGNLPEGIYFNSISSTLYCTGLVGLLLLLKITYDLIKSKVPYKKVFAVVFFLSLFFADTFTAPYICFYFSFMYAKDKYN